MTSPSRYTSRNNASGLRRLATPRYADYASSWSLSSACPVESDDFVGAHCDINPTTPQQGWPRLAPAACRGFVAFLDSDVTPRRGWLESLLGHFCDPTVALVHLASSAVEGENPVARYEATRRWTLVSAKRRCYRIAQSLTCRAPPSFAEFSHPRRRQPRAKTMHSGEDVDLCWRLIEEAVLSCATKPLRFWSPMTIGPCGTGSRARRYGSSAAPLCAAPDKTRRW